MVVFRTAALSLAATLLTTTTAGAIPVTEAGGHFFTDFTPLASYNAEVVSTSGAIRNEASSAAGQGASNPQPSITGEVNAKIASLGVF